MPSACSSTALNSCAIRSISSSSLHHHIVTRALLHADRSQDLVPQVLSQSPSQIVELLLVLCRYLRGQHSHQRQRLRQEIGRAFYVVSLQRLFHLVVASPEFKNVLKEMHCLSCPLFPQFE